MVAAENGVPNMSSNEILTAIAIRAADALPIILSAINSVLVA